MMTMILDWLATEFNISAGAIHLTPLAGDASARSYYRCRLDDYALNKHKYLVMQQPIEDSFFNFIKLAQQMRGWGLNVPEIYKINQQLGCLVLSDFGDDLYLTVLQQSLTANNNTANSLYTAAMDALLVMQTSDPKILATKLQLATMDENYLADRLMVFKTWFLQQHLQLDPDANMLRILADLTDLIAETYVDQPQVFVHLDYHSRNLLVLPNKSIGIIDFQDAMLGPLTYDLVSLLQDAYITWPRAQVERWVAVYQQRAQAQGLVGKLDFAKFMRLFDLVGLHRHLKNLGVFARLYHRDGKEQYLPHMPTLMQYILAACGRYADLAPFKKVVESLA